MSLLTHEEKKEKYKKRMERFGRFMDEFLVFFNLHEHNGLRISYDPNTASSLRRSFVSPEES